MTPKAVRRYAHIVLVPLVILTITQLLFALFLDSSKHEQFDLPVYTDPDVFGGHLRLDPLTGGSSHVDFASQWDGQWYRQIVEEGYPAELPRDEQGSIIANRWAFYPLYPSLVRGLMAVTGLPFATAGMILSLGFTLFGLVFLYGWITRATGSRWAGTIAVGSIALAPAAFVFGATYTEGLTLALLVPLLWMVSRGWVLRAIPLVVVLGFTRNIVPPLLIVGLLYAVITGLTYLRSTGLSARAALTENKGDVARYLALGLTTSASALFWPAWVGLATGVSTAYMETYSAWFGQSTTFTWFTAAPFSSWPNHHFGTAAFALLVLIVATYLAFNRRYTYPLVLRLFPLALALYIFVFTGPAGSEWRYLTMGFFLFPFTQVPTGRTARGLYFLMVGLFVVGALWFAHDWLNTYWIMKPGSYRLAP